MEINWKKKILAKIANFFFLFELYYYLLRLIKKNQYIRVVNYHGIESPDFFAKQVEFYSRWYSGVDLEDLRSFIKDGVWTKELPGIILSFDDGLYSSKKNAIEVIERYGFIGWFFIPTSFVSADEKDQVEFAKRGSIFFGNSSQKLAMSWDDIKQLDKNHVVGSHTQNHVRLS